MQADPREQGGSPADAAEQAAAEEFLQELKRKDRRAMRSILALAILSALGGTWALFIDHVGQGGILFAKFVGLSAGITFVALFCTILGVGVLVMRRWLLGHAEARRREVIRDRGLPEDSLEWVVAMFTPSAKGKAPADDA